MSDKHVIVVFGATGAQGGSVIKALCENDTILQEYSIRAVTRDTSKPEAVALREKGISTISADLSSKDDLRRALQDAHTVFLVTDFAGNGCNPERETQQGKNVADIAKELDVKHMIFSSLLAVSKYTNGKILKALEFDSKAATEVYIRELAIPATFVHAGFYMSLFTQPSRYFSSASEGKGPFKLALPLPIDKPVIPLIDAQRDFGKFVRAAILHRNELLGRSLFAAQAYYSMNQIARGIDNVKTSDEQICQVIELSDDEYLQLETGSGSVSEDRQEQRLQMFQYIRDYGYYGDGSIIQSHKFLDEKLLSWEDVALANPIFNY